MLTFLDDFDLNFLTLRWVYKRSPLLTFSGNFDLKFFKCKNDLVILNEVVSGSYMYLIISLLKYTEFTNFGPTLRHVALHIVDLANEVNNHSWKPGSDILVPNARASF